jgi:hypothetical protein
MNSQIFATTVAEIAKIGVRAVMARIDKERREREAASRQATLNSSADGRLVRPRPEPDGELLPTVRLLDELLASDQREEPPMRDASGNLVEVQVREPWELHLLTADGTNAAAEGGETMNAPPEPGLVPLTPIGIELLLERYVRWSVQKKNKCYFGTLHRPSIDGLREFFPKRHSRRAGYQYGAARHGIGQCHFLVLGSIALPVWSIGSIHSFAHACHLIRRLSRMFETP